VKRLEARFGNERLARTYCVRGVYQVLYFFANSEVILDTSATEEVIKLPIHFGGRDVQGMFAVCETVRTSTGAIVLDGSETAFFDPLGIAVLGALLEPLVGKRDVRIDWLSVACGSYLERMQVLSACNIQGVVSSSQYSDDLTHTLVELTKVEHERQVDEAVDRLATALAGKLSADRLEAFKHPLRYVLSELLLNALSHAKREGRSGAAVWVACQYYRKNKGVQLAVVDNGCGLLETLRYSRHLPEKTHAAAIPTALKPFVSCNPDLGLPGGTANRGIGLTTTAKIAQSARGRLLIVSGDAGMYSDGRPFRLEGGAKWDGVAISMRCRRAALPGVNIAQMMPKDENSMVVPMIFE